MNECMIHVSMQERPGKGGRILIVIAIGSRKIGWR